jgi:hypothetical protein
MIKYTTGNWSVQEIVGEISGHVVLSDNGATLARIARFCPVYPYKLPSAENARLISAAPDMLEALQSIVDSAKSGGLSQDDVVRLAAPAIKKALRPD